MMIYREERCIYVSFFYRRCGCGKCIRVASLIRGAEPRGSHHMARETILSPVHPKPGGGGPVYPH
jgi:hypothetical protein